MKKNLAIYAPYPQLVRLQRPLTPSQKTIKNRSFFEWPQV
jgi:hypothetical protein